MGPKTTLSDAAAIADQFVVRWIADLRASLAAVTEERDRALGALAARVLMRD